MPGFSPWMSFFAALGSSVSAQPPPVADAEDSQTTRIPEIPMGAVVYLPVYSNTFLTAR